MKKVDLEINAGEFFVILGPSGCGKSTLLNIIAGLEKPTGGEIWLGERLISSVKDNVYLSPRERNVAMVFQSYALYPHMSVFENIAFPLRISKVPKDEVKQKAEGAANLLGISSLLNARPRELSGGERQRVAIARAIVRHPSVFLLDEPLSNLDAQLRFRMRVELKSLQRKLGITTVYVTHDQSEALTLGDRLAILKDGRVQQIGTPLGVYNEPSNIFVAGFLGTPPMNLIQAEAVDEGGGFFARVGDIKIELSPEQSGSLDWREFILGIRPEDIRISTERGAGFSGKVKLVENLGREAIVYLEIGGETVTAKTQGDSKVKEGDEVNIFVEPERVHIFSKDNSIKRP